MKRDTTTVRESVCPMCKGGGKGFNARGQQLTGTFPARAPSSPDLPFFESRPEEPTDRHYCGCMGWD